MSAPTPNAAPAPLRDRTRPEPAAPPTPEPAPERVESLLLRVAGGGSLRESCRVLGLDERRFRAALLDDPGLAERFARARWCSADAQFDEIQELERRVLDGELEAATLRAVLDARKWRLARLRPAVYGDRSAAPSSPFPAEDAAPEDGDARAPRTPPPDLSGLTPEQLLELTRLVFAAGPQDLPGDAPASSAPSRAVRRRKASAPGVAAETANPPEPEDSHA